MRWTLKPKPDSQKVAQLQEALNVNTLIASLLVQRGIESFQEAKDFFRPSLAHLHDPFLMKDMRKAVTRVEQALANHERILVYGDYDVDGTTSVALMSSYLQNRQASVATYIPDRYTEGYGVSFAGIDFAADNEFSLMIALDCGIKAIDKIEYAKQKGIDVIICDHHRPGKTLPQAYAVLDPKREDCTYPYKELCGCGVGFKLIQALEQLRGNSVETLTPYLDLVATAIGADIVPITGENRVLAYVGLQQINTKPRVGFQAILKEVKKTELTITDVVFIIAPRINAAGRMKHGLHAVQLLTETDFETAQIMANEIEAYNTDRREQDRSITEEALSDIKKKQEENRFTTVVYREHWHKGVIGIVASRLTETYYRPTLVFTKSGDKLAASARSVKGFDVYNALEACQDYIEQFGGHKYAAGLTLAANQYEAFKEKFEAVVAESISQQQLIPEVSIDLPIDFHEITPKTYRILKQFAPFGPGNMQPVFMTTGVNDTGFAKSVGKDKEHLKCRLYQTDKATSFDAIGFFMENKFESLTKNESVDVAYSVEENTWNGNTSLQLKLKAIR